MGGMPMINPNTLDVILRNHFRVIPTQVRVKHHENSVKGGLSDGTHTYSGITTKYAIQDILTCTHIHMNHVHMHMCTTYVHVHTHCVCKHVYLCRL